MTGGSKLFQKSYQFCHSFRIQRRFHQDLILTLFGNFCVKLWKCNLSTYFTVILWLRCQVGDPVLRKIAEDVPESLIASPEVKFLASRMKSVLEDYKLVGLAAPQIGISLRIFIMSFGEHSRKKITPEVYKAKEMSMFPTTVFINPKIKVLDYKKITFEEGCASIIGLKAEVTRNYSVQVTAFDENGQKIEHIFTGWNSRIAQHETDHLNGILFTDIMNRKTLRCTNWELINKKRGKLALPYYVK